LNKTQRISNLSKFYRRATR